MNRYTRIIVDEAERRGIEVTVLDALTGELELRFAGRRVFTIQSLSELASAVALRRCDDKVRTRRVLARAGIPLAPGRLATFDALDVEFLAEHRDIVVKPARGEGGQGISVGVTDPLALEPALVLARSVCEQVLLEQRVEGDDVRVVVIDREVVAAAVRRPARVVGDGTSTVAELVTAAGRVPVDATAAAVVAWQGLALDDVPAEGHVVLARRTANVHTGGTIDDVTDELHPALAELALRVVDAIGIPVCGVDLMVADVARPEAVVIEANEQPGLANHEPRPTAERFVDLLFPETRQRPH
jgi:GNAT-family acetyltransferase (TIGR03103 family)